MPAKSRRKYFQKTRAEKLESRKLNSALKTYIEVQTDPDESAHAKVEAQRAEKQCRRQLQALDAAIAGRKLEFESEFELKSIQEKFPESVPATVSDLQEALYSLEADPKYLAAKQYLSARVKDLQTATNDAAAEERAAKRLIEEQRENADFLAAERARNEVLNWANPLLVKPMSIKVRAALQEKCKAEAKKCRVALSSTSADKMDENGAHMTAVIRGYLDTFEELQERLEIFDYDLTRPPSDESLKANSKLFNLGCAPENWNFRSTTGKVSEEQCRAKLACERYFNITHQEYRVESLPNVPLPTVIPKAGSDTLTRVMMAEQANVQGHDSKVLQEQERQARLERLRKESPKEFAKLSAEALEPLNLDNEATVIYKVETRTAEKPNSPARYYFPHGGEAIRGRDFFYDVHKRQWLGTPDIAIGWTLTPRQPKMSDAELEREAQLAAADRFAEFHSHVHTDAIDSEKRSPVKEQASISPTPFLQPPIEFRDGDHKPPDGDPRTEFRYGSWFLPEQIEEADKTAARSYSTSAPYQDRQRYRMESPTTLYRPEGMGPRGSSAWASHEAKLETKSEDQL